MKIKLVILFLFAALAGCATPVPPQVDINDGIFSRTPDSSPMRRVTGGADRTLLVVLSKNTKANIDYLNGLQESRGKEVVGYQSIIDAHIESLDPRFPSRWIISQLKTKFGHVKLVGAESVDSQKTSTRLS